MFFVTPQEPPAVADGLSAGGRRLIYSASDLVRAAECPWAAQRILDEKLQRVPRLETAPDPMLERASRLGDAHEYRVLEELRVAHGPSRPGAGLATAEGCRITGVVEIEPASRMDWASLKDKHEESLSALREGADVVFQASFFDGSFHGRADFLIRQEDGSYAVYDTKLARHAKVTALLQLAAYADQLEKAGVPVSDTATLILGSGEHASYSVRSFLDVYRERAERFEQMAASRLAADSPAEWTDEMIGRCGVCPHCQAQVEEHDDLLQVAGMSMQRRRRLQDEFGIRTVRQLAEADGSQLPSSLEGVALQARMQMGLAEPDGETVYQDAEGGDHSASYLLLPGAQRAFQQIPRANPGDIFFDFEGDPMWQSPSDGSWGLEYLFGLVEHPRTEEEMARPRFIPFWAHSRAEEKKALLDFLDYVFERRARFPGMKIYHYANYEKRALRELAARHGAGEEQVDTLLREDVLVDLYPIVKDAMRVSQPSYSIKKLEPFYMPPGDLRAGDVTSAAGSVVAYASYCEARDLGDGETADAVLAEIADYNEYDCRSTLFLRNWLLQLADRSIDDELASPPRQVPAVLVDHDDAAPTAVEDEIMAFVERSIEEGGLSGLADSEERLKAAAMVASAVGYYRRERKPFWWSHFERLVSPLEEWEESRDVLVFDRLEVVTDWHKPSSRHRSERRILEGTAKLADGSSLKPGASGLFAMYDSPLPPYLEDAVLEMQEKRDEASGGNATPVLRAAEAKASIESIEPGPSPDTARVRFSETRPGGSEPFDHLPIALTPPAPLRTAQQEQSLTALAEETLQRLPQLPIGCGMDILLRNPPRLKTLPRLPQPTDPEHATAALPVVSAILSAVLDLDCSYAAVQGPPGTGKSFVGGHVIGELVRRGWKIGVVAQSHAVIGNLLRGCLKNGRVAGGAIAQAAKQNPHPEAPELNDWRYVTDKQIGVFLGGSEAGDSGPAGGRVYGGTAWDFANESRFEPGSLDLLVIDEAGQYSLANTLAVARAAKNILLLGDPQQLPQVTQGSHPQPVDESALGWLAAGQDTLPPERGYFLEQTWRMHPELCRPVSLLSYQGRLESAPAAALRRLEGLKPGVYRRDVPHRGNATSSPEEAAEIVRLAASFIGRTWNPGPEHSGRPRPDRTLEPDDVLVVAAYNAQVELIQEALADAGLYDPQSPEASVRVGTVDRFQGQEAPVVLVSMAASDASAAPRGMEFLLSPNRLNVAVSRGQWCAVIVSSPALTDYWPSTPAGLALLGGFTGLRQRAMDWPGTTTPLR